jgi:3'(2'), 5'-bisphosphate nucleotidase
MRDEDLEELALALMATAREAGAVIMHYRDLGAPPAFKPDGSPVTAADQAAEELILRDLDRLAPALAVVAEETAARAGAGFDPDQPFFLVDPLDGTRDFIAGGNEFTVNIALIRGREPVFGLIFAPASGRLFVTRGRGEAAKATIEPGAQPLGLADLTPIWTRVPDSERLTVCASRSHLNEETSAYMATLKVGETLRSSSSIKFCQIAEGSADVYPRLAPTCEWDTAAGHAILTAAGGAVLGKDGAPLAYGKFETGFLNPGFLAWGRRPGGKIAPTLRDS